MDFITQRHSNGDFSVFAIAQHAHDDLSKCEFARLRALSARASLGSAFMNQRWTKLCAKRSDDR